MENRQITYTRLIAEGFQSLVTQFSMPLNQTGLNIIRGDNGFGKSTIFNAILWAEFGENLKTSVATWEDKRPDTFRGTRVIIERTDGQYDYRIVRHLNFKGTTLGITGGSSLMIYKKECIEPAFTAQHQIGSGLDKRGTQDLIVDQLGLDSTTYVNSIIFGQRVASLVEAENKDKRELFDRLFAVGFVDFAKANADKSIADTNSDIAVLETKVTNSASSIELAETKYNEAKKQLEDFDTLKKTRIAEAQADVVKYEKLIADSELLNTNDSEALAALSTKLLDAANKTKTDLEAKLKILESNGTGFSTAKSAHDESVRKANANLTKYDTELSEVKEKCPTCSAPIKAADLKNVKDNIKSKIQAEKKVLEALGTYDSKPMDKNLQLIDSCKASIDEAKKEIAKFDNLVEDRTKLSTNIANREENITTYSGFLKDAKTRLDNEKKAQRPKLDLSELSQNIQALNEQRDAHNAKLLDKKKNKEHTEWWIKKGFGATGIKSFVFNAMLGQLNKYSLKYAARLGFRVEFTIDLSKASRPFQTLIYSGDNVRDYKDLSGGQKQRVDVCLAFAMHDLITANTSFNIFVVDEMTEGLDRLGTEAVFEFLRMKAESKAVYVITHLDILDSTNARIINVSNDNGNTVLE